MTNLSDNAKLPVYRKKEQVLWRNEKFRVVFIVDESEVAIFPSYWAKPQSVTLKVFLLLQVISLQHYNNRFI